MSHDSFLLDAISYWEPKRIWYNVCLTVAALICWGPEIFAGGPREWIGGLTVLAVFAIIANILFCFAYPVDFVLQMSSSRPVLDASRTCLFSLGLILALSFALWIMLGTGMA